MTETSKIAALRTPDKLFNDLVDYPFKPNYVEIDGLRMHYVDEGPSQAHPVLLLHGHPTWSYLYRHMIPIIAKAGHRVIAPDLIGFGRSDKPIHRSDHTYSRHVQWMAKFIEILDLKNITLVGHDWGGLIGLRLVTTEQENRLGRIIASNTTLPINTNHMLVRHRLWKWFARYSPIFPVAGFIQLGCKTKLSSDIIAAYSIPYPDRTYKAGAKQFPSLIPTSSSHPEALRNQVAWQVLERWEKPFLTAFSDNDTINYRFQHAFQQKVPGAKGHPHAIIKDAGHFLQEDKGPELAQTITNFIAAT